MITHTSKEIRTGNASEKRKRKDGAIERRAPFHMGFKR